MTAMTPRPLPAVALLVMACTASTSPSPTPPEPTPTVTAAAPAPAPTPTPSPTAAPAPASSIASSPAPAPEPAPKPANATPASLHLALHGKCDYLGVSTVDDQTFVHYRTRSKDHLLRLGPDGELIEPIPLDFPPKWRTSIYRVLGRWPDQLLLLTQLETRDGTTRLLYRQTAEGWRMVETLGSDANYEDAWPWVDGSILALAQTGGDYEHRSRLAVVRGEGKGPSLAKIRRAGKCPQNELWVTDAVVLGDGSVVATAECEGTWVATWPPSGGEGTVTRVRHESYSSFVLGLDDQGQGFLMSSSEMMRWSDGHATLVELPGGRGEPSFAANGGQAWVVRRDHLWRYRNGDWERVATPEGRRIDSVSGLEHDTPWLEFTDGTVAMQTADATWHDVPLPAVPQIEQTPKATRIHVVAPGDAFIASRYTEPRKGSKSGAKRNALYTTRQNPTPQVCGEQSA